MVRFRVRVRTSLSSYSSSTGSLAESLSSSSSGVCGWVRGCELHGEGGGQKSRWLRGTFPPNIKQGRLALNIHTTNTTHATTHARVFIVELAHAQAHSERESARARTRVMGWEREYTDTLAHAHARAHTHTHTTVTTLKFRRDFGRSLSLPSGHGLVGRGHGKGLSIHGVDRPVLKLHHLRVRRVRPLSGY